VHDVICHSSNRIDLASTVLTHRYTLNMTSKPSTDHEKYADEADDYLDEHNIYGLFSSLMRQLAIHQPADPLNYMQQALQQPIEQLRILVVSPPHPTTVSSVNNIVRGLGLIRLQFSQLVNEEVARRSQLGSQLQPYVDATERVPDELAVLLIQTRTNKSDAVGQGWILEGYPNNRAQSLALQSSGILPTHLLHFTAPTATLNTLTANASNDPVATAALSAYQRNGRTVADAFSHCAVVLDLSQPASNVQAELERVLQLPPPSTTPRRPLRVLLLGPKGSGKATVAAALARKYALVHINANDLIRREIAKGAHGLVEKTKSYLSSGMLIPDDLIVPLVLARVKAADAKKCGFILEGFPRTIAQADALEKGGIKPNRVVILRASEEECIARVTTRRVDPETGDEYHFASDADMAAAPNLSAAIKERLIHAANDKPSTLEAINFTINSDLEELKQRYAVRAGDITSTGPKPGEEKNEEELQRAKQRVFEQVEDFLLAPLNSSYLPNVNHQNGK